MKPGTILLALLAWLPAQVALAQAAPKLKITA